MTPSEKDEREWFDDLMIEKAARATWLIEHRKPGGGLLPASAWRDLAPSIKEAEREKVRAAARLLRMSLSALDRPRRAGVAS